MLLLKENQLNEAADEDIYVRAPKKRVMPSRASYYANTVEKSAVPSGREEYTVEFIRGGRPAGSSMAVEDLNINDSALVEPDLKQYEKLSPDLLPSNATMRSLSAHRSVENIESAEEVVDFKINKKGLLMLMIYAVIIIAIFTFIIVNAVSLVNLMNTTGSLEQQLKTVNSDINNLEAEIEKASDPVDLVNRLEGEWVPAKNDGTIVLNVTTPEQDETESSTNVYDWILDNLFGGGF